MHLSDTHRLHDMKAVSFCNITTQNQSWGDWSILRALRFELEGIRCLGLNIHWAFCWIRDKNLPSISIHINLIQLKVCKAHTTQTKRSRRGRGLIAVMTLTKLINKLFWNWLIFDIVDFHNILLLNILLLFYCFI